MSGGAVKPRMGGAAPAKGTATTRTAPSEPLRTGSTTSAQTTGAK